MKVIPSAHFQRVYRKYFSKLNLQQRKEVEDRIDLFIGNHFLPQLRTHKLTSGEWAFIRLRLNNFEKIIFAEPVFIYV